MNEKEIEKRARRLFTRKLWREKNKDKIKVSQQKYIAKVGKDEPKLRRFIRGK